MLALLYILMYRFLPLFVYPPLSLFWFGLFKEVYTDLSRVGVYRELVPSRDSLVQGQTYHSFHFLLDLISLGYHVTLSVNSTLFFRTTFGPAEPPSNSPGRDILPCRGQRPTCNRPSHFFLFLSPFHTSSLYAFKERLTEEAGI